MNEIHTWALLWAGSYARCCDCGEETEVLVGRQTSKQAMMVQDEKCTDAEIGEAGVALGKGPGPNKRKSRARRNSPFGGGWEGAVAGDRGAEDSETGLN